MFGSIRWRLVASYVLLTLLTVGVMGGLALSLVWRYVDHREVEFLTANAEAVARHALPLVASPGQVAELDELARSSAFLINARVRLLDARQQVLADSGPVTATDQLIWIAAPGDPLAGAVVAGHLPSEGVSGGVSGGAFVSPPGEAAFTQRVAPLDPEPAHVAGVAAMPLTEAPAEPFELHVAGSPALAAGSDSLTAKPRIMAFRRQVGPWGDRLDFEVVHDGAQAGSVLTPTRHISFSAALSVPDFFALDPSAAPVGHALAARSVRGIKVPVGGPAAALGYVEISQGPDLTSAAVRTTARAFGIAALGAALLAGLLGLVVSRGMTAPVQSLAAAASQMSGGDLSARAPVRGRDELAELARQFNAMAERLQASFAELAADRDALRRFVADASHELRTPITALRSFNELLQTSAATDPTAQAEFLAESQAQIRRLAWITTNLLDLSRLDAGLVTLERAACDPAELIEAALAPLRPVAAERGIELAVRPPPEPLVLTCDAARVELALSNLLDNALKFTPSAGDVEIGVLGQPDPSDPDAAPAIAFWVRDSGPGIAADDLPHVFERFYRGRPDPDGPPAQGSGLGLAIVHSVAQVHGGTAWVESEPGAGACFWLRLPEQGPEGWAPAPD